MRIAANNITTLPTLSEVKDMVAAVRRAYKERQPTQAISRDSHVFFKGSGNTLRVKFVARRCWIIDLIIRVFWKLCGWSRHQAPGGEPSTWLAWNLLRLHVSGRPQYSLRYTHMLEVMQNSLTQPVPDNEVIQLFQAHPENKLPDGLKQLPGLHLTEAAYALQENPPIPVENAIYATDVLIKTIESSNKSPAADIGDSYKDMTAQIQHDLAKLNNPPDAAPILDAQDMGTLLAQATLLKSELEARHDDPELAARDTSAADYEAQFNAMLLVKQRIKYRILREWATLSDKDPSQCIVDLANQPSENDDSLTKFFRELLKDYASQITANKRFDLCDLRVLAPLKDTSADTLFSSLQILDASPLGPLPEIRLNSKGELAAGSPQYHKRIVKICSHLHLRPDNCVVE